MNAHLKWNDIVIGERYTVFVRNRGRLQSAWTSRLIDKRAFSGSRTVSTLWENGLWESQDLIGGSPADGDATIYMVE